MTGKGLVGLPLRVADFEAWCRVHEVPPWLRGKLWFYIRCLEDALSTWMSGEAGREQERAQEERPK